MSEMRPGAETRRFGRTASLLSAGVGTAGVLTYLFFSLASHNLDATDYGEIVVLWSAVFVSISVAYRPVEQLLSRTLADRIARGEDTGPAIRTAARLQLAISLLLAIAILVARGPLQDELLSGSETLYWVLFASVASFGASFFARGYLGGTRRFTLLAGLLVAESAARTLFLPPCEVTPGRLAGFELVYLSGITLAVLEPAARAELRAFLAAHRARGGAVAFDSNYRPRLWRDAATARDAMAAFWRLTDIGLPSLDDEVALWGDADAAAALARLAGWGVTRGGLKRGAEGPLAIGWDGPLPDFPQVTPIDTTAAGDSFNGAFLAAHLAGAPPSDCLAAGHALASRVVRHPGAIMPA